MNSWSFVTWSKNWKCMRRIVPLTGRYCKTHNWQSVICLMTWVYCFCQIKFYKKYFVTFYRSVVAAKSWCNNSSLVHSKIKGKPEARNYFLAKFFNQIKRASIMPKYKSQAVKNKSKKCTAIAYYHCFRIFKIWWN